MKRLRSRKRFAVACAALAVASLGVTGVALGVVTLSLGVLADANTVNDGKFESEDGEIELKTKGPVRVRVVHTGVTNGFNSGWHTHPGPAIVAVKQGTFLITQGSCEPTEVGPGQAYIEKPNVPVLATASGEIEWVTTLILPIGAPPATSVAPPCP